MQTKKYSAESEEQAGNCKKVWYYCFCFLGIDFHSLILFLEQKAEYGDSSLIGADPSSLAISLMLIFWRHFRKKQLKRDYDKRPNIYVDMMVRKNIQVINHRYEYIYGPISRLIRDKANPFNSIKFRWFDHNNLDFIRKRNNIIISHPPDLSYGIIFYLNLPKFSILSSYHPSSILPVSVNGGLIIISSLKS